MLDNPINKFITKELEPDILSTSFKVKTSWHVITGAPCSGKSTLIDQLADSGFQTAPEAARLYFEREVATGRTVEEIRGDSIPCIQGIIDMMLEFERGFFPDEIIFLDRGCPDVLAFCRQFGVDPNDFLPECFHHRYASIFLLDRFPVHLNGIRVEDEAAADYLDKWHYRDYIALGYQVVRVPVLPPEERLAFVLEIFSEQNQI